MFALLATVLCLLSVSHSAPLDCESLVRPFDRLDPQQAEGSWVLVAGSLNYTGNAAILKARDSVTIDFHDSAFTQADRVGERCDYNTLNISVDGQTFDYKTGAFNFSGKVFHTSCPDCMVIRLDVQSSFRVTTDLYLLSKRRELEEKEMEEFKAQVECLLMPPAIVMDPTKELCPKQATSSPAAPTEEKTD
eukprot:superscaffoldBa00004572_g19101